MPREGRNVDRTLRGKMRAEIEESHHRFYLFRYGGQLVLKTKLSTPIPKDLNDSLMKKVAEQLHLDGGRRELESLCDCTKSADEWQKHVERCWRQNQE